jgi:STE24 endopeptidase
VRKYVAVLAFLESQYHIIHTGTFLFTQVFIGTAHFYELHSPIIAIFSLITLVVKRYFEFQSDSYAVRLGYGKELKASLIKLYKDSAPKMRPDFMYAWINYSHPTLWERI